MKNFILAMALVLTSAVACLGQMTTITASSIKMGGVNVAAGLVTFTPVNVNGTPIPFVTGGGGGLNDPSAISCTIKAGALSGSCQIPDSALTTPANLLYEINISNTGTNKNFRMQVVPNITGTTWALDSYAPPATTSNVQSIQSAYGTANPSSSCIAPSFYTQNASGGKLFACVGGVFIQIAGGAVTYGTTAGTATQGNDPRVVNAIQTTSKGVANGVASLDGAGQVPLSQLGNAPSGGDGGTTYTGTAPVVVTGSVISLALGTSGTTAAAGNDSRIVSPNDATARTAAAAAQTTANAAAVKANNLSDLASPSTARTNLGVDAAGSATGLRGIPVAATAPTAGKVLGSDGTSWLPVTPAVASVAGKTGAITLTPYDVGAVVGPIAGSSQYSTGPLSTAYDATNGLLPIVSPTDSTNIQAVFGNVTGLPETPGPLMTVTASFEYPQGTLYPMFFNGDLTGTVSPGGLLYSDPVSADLPAGTVGYIRYHVTRPVGSVGFPSTRTFGAINGTMLAPNTTTHTGGYYDGIENITQRSLTDVVTTAASQTFTSATAAFTQADRGQLISITGAGTAGAVLNTYIYSVTNATTALLGVVAPTAVTGAAASITAADKTGLVFGFTPTIGSSISGNDNTQGYAPFAILGQSGSAVKTVGLVGDSITYGNGGNLAKGSWAVQALSAAAIVAKSDLATSVAPSLPFINSSMGGETVANLIVKHQTRYSMLGRTKYTLGMLGTNDINGLVAAATIEANLVTLWKQITLRGSKPYYGTIVPQNSSTDYWLTTTNQSANSYEPQRVLINNWMRDGAPISSTTGLPVAVGSPTATTNRCVFYVGGVAQVNPTSGTALASGPGTHPASGLFELANSVETAQDSGIWKVNPGNRTVTDASITTGLKVLTSATAAFSSADVGHYVSVAGAGASGGYLAAGNTIASVQSATQATLSVAASTTVTGATAAIDGQATTNGINSGDGRHPGGLGHAMMGVEAAKMVAVWQ